MPGPERFSETLLEGTTGYFSFSIVDEEGEGIPLALISTLQLTYFDVDSGEVINDRLHQNILNANGVNVVTELGPPITTTVTWEITPADTVILNEGHGLEQRVMQFRWTWNTGARCNAYEAQFGVENMSFVP